MLPRVRRFFRVMHREGVLAGLELATLRLGTAVAGQDWIFFKLIRMTDRWYDWRTGLDTGGILPQGEIQIDPTSGRNYAGTPPRTWRHLMRHLPIEPGRFTYVDLGCGKGRTLVLAVQTGFRRVIGVELSERMAEIARRNSAKAGCGTTEVVLLNAVEYKFPSGPLVLFLYNPFWKDVMERVASNLDHSLKEEPREAYLVYWRPRFREVFDGLNSLALYRDCDALYPWYAIYKSTL